MCSNEGRKHNHAVIWTPRCGWRVNQYTKKQSRDNQCPAKARHVRDGILVCWRHALSAKNNPHEEAIHVGNGTALDAAPECILKDVELCESLKPKKREASKRNLGGR